MALPLSSCIATVPCVVVVPSEDLNDLELKDVEGKNS